MKMSKTNWLGLSLIITKHNVALTIGRWWLTIIIYQILYFVLFFTFNYQLHLLSPCYANNTFETMFSIDLFYTKMFIVFFQIYYSKDINMLFDIDRSKGCHNSRLEGDSRCKKKSSLLKKCIIVFQLSPGMLK